MPLEHRKTDRTIVFRLASLIVKALIVSGLELSQCERFEHLESNEKFVLMRDGEKFDESEIVYIKTNIHCVCEVQDSE
jgi:hypothetical protein